MPLNQAELRELVHDEFFPVFQAERERLDRIDRWYRWQHEDPKLPNRATPELRQLVELAKTPWLGLVVTAISQQMYVDGYQSPDNRDNEGPWRTWQANDFDGRQIAVHRAALAYGQSYATALPGTNDQGEPATVLRGVSPRKMVAFYADPVEDDWPMYALRAEVARDKTWLLRVYDDERVYFASMNTSGDDFEFIEWREHGAGVCPVVRYANMLDLDGRTDGEVEPFISVASRIDKTAFDRLLTQHFSSWKIRTVAGMAEPSDEEEANRKKLQLRQDDMLIADDPDTKFGTLDETPLDGFIRAHEADVETLAAVSQTPSHQLTGKMINLSADALAEARAGLNRKVDERQRSFGKSHDQLLRLAASLDGDAAGARDITARVTWADLESRSLSQAVDALGKAAQMLGVPVQALWGRIPGVSKTDVDEWKAMAAESDSMGRLVEALNRQAEPSPNGQGSGVNA